MFSFKDTLIFIIFVKHVVFICACPINLENDTAEYCRQALSLLGLLPETYNFNFHPPVTPSYLHWQTLYLESIHYIHY